MKLSKDSASEQSSIPQPDPPEAKMAAHLLRHDEATAPPSDSLHSETTSAVQTHFIVRKKWVF